MLIPKGSLLPAWLVLSLLLYTWAPRTWIPGETVTASMMNGLRDLFNAIHDYFFPTETFRGLTLQTHPDADVAASKVMLVHADQIVMHDGERVADWNNLAADITVSGANGLDTGSEVASCWYEIHAIRNSTDGTKGLLLHRAKNYARDQSQLTNTNPSNVRYSAAIMEAAQTFTAGLSGAMPFADIGINKVGSPTGEIWLEIRATAAGAPTGAALYTSNKMDVSGVSTSSHTVRFVFMDPPVLASGTVYALVLNGNWTVSTSNYIQIRYNSAGGYAGGAAYYVNAGVWTLKGSTDYLFATYITQNETDPTIPAGYDQRALIGWVYNNSGSNFLAFIAHDRDVRYAWTTTNAVSAGTATLQTLVDLSAYLPPVPVTVTQARLALSSAATYLAVSGRLGNGYDGGILWRGIADATDAGVSFPLDFQYCYYLTTGTSSFTPGSYRW